MSFGSFNEYMIFPIVEIVRKELRNQILRGELSIDKLERVNEQHKNIILQNNNTNKNIVYEGNLMSRLESNDFDLTLERNDPVNPNILTGVIIKYGEDLWQAINLIRENKKLTNVKISVIIREPISESVPNPLGMGGSHFIEYTRNKRIILHYKTVIEDEASTPEDINKAHNRLLFLENRNQEIRNLYGITIDKDLNYIDLIEYIANPLGMESTDYTKYCWNIRIWWSDTATLEEKTEASKANTSLRELYGISDDDVGVFVYDELKNYLANPLGMLSEDYNRYVTNKRILSILDPLNPEHEDKIDSLIAENDNLLVKYYTEDIYTLEELESYLETNDMTYKETMLLKVLISLIYNGEGKLVDVKSVTLEGDY